MIRPDKLIEQGIDAVEGMTNNPEEVRTERLLIDSKTDSWLSRSIRPLITLWLALVWTALGVTQFVMAGFIAPEYIYTTGALLGAAIGFYFNSRRQEKIKEKQVEAGLKMAAIQQKHENKAERNQTRGGIFKRRAKDERDQ